MIEQKNYYGSLCTELYELLHPTAPQEELDFYLSYAAPGQAILEALCGSGRFLVPFMERGFAIEGIDLSAEMLAKLRHKAPDAKVYCCDIQTFAPGKVYDYIFITSGSVSLFTDPAHCRDILQRLRQLLAPNGVLVFAVDVLASRCPEDADYQLTAQAKTPEGFDLLLKSKNHYDARTQTQFMPGLYELYDAAAAEGSHGFPDPSVPFWGDGAAAGPDRLFQGDQLYRLFQADRRRRRRRDVSV